MKGTRNALVAYALALAGVVQATSLKDVEHIILFMQENRAFDHYFGTMAGVRNFGDPNVQVNPDGRTVFEQPLGKTENGTDILKPWYINYLGGDYVESTQCMGAGDNGWTTMHSAYNGGLGNNWPGADGGKSMAYFKREDIPTHFDIVEGWTVLDMNTQSILAATDPNRIFWMSGSVNIPGSPSNPDGKGGIIIDNSATPGCEKPGINCFPFVWKTFPEYLEEAGVSWQVYQDMDNFEDNMLAYFEQYQTAKNGSALREKGNSYPGLDAFYKDAAAGTLPQISYIIGPQELAEHPPNRPVDGAWLQRNVVEAVTSSPLYKNTVMVISYDEQGGWADYVVPEVPEKGTPGEWLEDPYGKFGDVPLGPGWRTPRYIISPWTRGGNVFTERSDHTSDIMFIEEWAKAHGYSGVYSKELTQWRRDHMSNLVNALDFNNPDYSVPDITSVPTPQQKPNGTWSYTGNLTLGSLSGSWVGPAQCLSDYKSPAPPIPYGPDNANQDMSSLTEEGFKRVRGALTEGRYLTFELFGVAVTNTAGRMVGVSLATKEHNAISQRWILHAVNGTSDSFYVQSAKDSKYISGFPLGALTPDVSKAQPFTFDYHADGATYGLKLADTSSDYLGVNQPSSRLARRKFSLNWKTGFTGFEIFAVSYHS